ncbi:Exonuclease [Kushneria avicenniae]|uniref:Exonuclease n=1 Tax=Kushneria avicenniae TaxID=402385 RepID=A0A1I1JVX2_9GAMM|nr:3'-5' exonuclease [Kushneria avicenniae]SFC52787.1 Exonuclease [Kushneria avicenniae]
MRALIHDFETAGGSARHCGVVQLAVLGGVLHTDGRFESQWQHSAHYHPGGSIDPATTRVHGIHDEDVAQCPDYRHGIPPVYREATRQGFDALVMGYSNTGFDNVIARRLGCRPRRSLDLFIPAYRLKKRDGLESASLGHMYRELTGGEPTHAHEALFDVTMTAALVTPLMARFGFEDFASFLDWATVGQPVPGLRLRFGPSRGKTIESLDDDALTAALNGWRGGNIDVHASLDAEYTRRGLTLRPEQGRLF